MAFNIFVLDDKARRALKKTAGSFDDLRRSVRRADGETAVVEVKAETTRARKDFNRLISRLDQVAGRRIGINLVITGTPLILETLTTVAAAAGGIASTFATAAAATGAFGLVAVPILTDVKEAHEELADNTDDHVKAVSELRVAQREYNKLGTKEALEEVKDAQEGVAEVERERRIILGTLSKEQRAFLKQVGALGKEWNKLLDAMSGPVFDVAAAGLKAVRPLLPSVEKVARPAADAFEQLAESLQGLSENDEFKNFVAFLSANAAPTILNFGQIAKNLTRGLAGLITAFSGLGTEVLVGLVNMTDAFADWAQTLETRPAFREFVQSIRRNGPLVKETLGAIASVIGELVQAFREIAPPMMRVITAIADFTARFLEAHPAMARVIASTIVITAAFRTLVRPLLTLAIAGRSVVSAFLGIGRGGKKLSRVFKNTIPAAFNTTPMLRFRVAMIDLGERFPRLGAAFGRMGKGAKAAGRAVLGLGKALGIAGIGIAVAVPILKQLNNAIHGAPPEVQNLATALQALGTGGALTKQTLSELGVSMGDLRDSIAVLQETGPDALFRKKFDLGSLTNATDKVKRLDEALAQMVAGGQGVAAANAIRKLGLDAAATRDLLPGYTAALARADIEAQNGAVAHQSIAQKMRQEGLEAQNLAGKLGILSTKYLDIDDKTLQFKQTLQTLTQGIKDNTLSGLDQRQMINSLVRQTKGIIETMIEKGATEEEVTEVANKHRKQLAKVMRQADFTEKEIKALQKRYKLTPEEIETLFQAKTKGAKNRIKNLTGFTNTQLDAIRDQMVDFRFNVPFAHGGRVSGRGTETSDSIPARLSRGEHVLAAREVQGMGGHSRVEQMRREARRGFARGGAVDERVNIRFRARNIDAVKDAIRDALRPAGFARGLAFAAAQDGERYQWGGVGPSGWDCSGFMSGIVNAIFRRNPFRRLFTTFSFSPGRGAAGFVPNMRSPFMIGVTNSGAGHMCLTGEMLADGPDGPHRMDEIQPGVRVWSYDEGALKAHTVVRAGFTARQEVLKVRLSKGRSVIASANHPFLVVRDTATKRAVWEGGNWVPVDGRQRYGARGIDPCGVSNCERTVWVRNLCHMHYARWQTHGDPRWKYTRETLWKTQWVRLDQLRLDDLIVRTKVPFPNNGELTVLPDGTEVTEDVAWLIGLMVGDGNFRDWKVRLSVFNPDIQDRASDVWKSLTGRPASRPQAKTSPPLSLNSAHYARVFEQMGMRKLGPQKRVPTDVWSWPEKLQLAFLDGYCDADGYRPKTGSYAQRRYSSASYNLIAEVRALHIALGDGVSNIGHRKPGRSRSSFDGSKDSWSFDVYEGVKNDGVPWDDHHSWGLQRLASSWDGQFGLSRVLAIDPLGERDTYDITVEGTHSFSVDGIHVHNSGTLLGVNVESSGSAGVRVGGGARGAFHPMFPMRFGLVSPNRAGGGGDPLGREGANFQRGAFRVPQTGPALVHRDEMVLPQRIASAVRHELAGGGGDPLIGTLVVQTNPNASAGQIVGAVMHEVRVARRAGGR